MKIRKLNIKCFANPFSLLFITILMSSCAAFDQHVAEVKAARAAADRDACIAKGFTVNTDPFRLCLDNRQLERKMRIAKSRQQNKIDNLQDEIDEMKTDQSFSCIASGGVQVGNTCIK